MKKEKDEEEEEWNPLIEKRYVIYKICRNFVAIGKKIELGLFEFLLH